MKKISFLLVLLAAISFSCSQSTNKKTESTTEAQPVATTEIVYHVEGMTCDDCEKSIQKGVNQLDGISLVEANHEDSTARVVFDPAKTDAQQIAAAIEKRGYQVVK
ncbi:MAG TPA: cation transporter [Sunxiuqinia sp.]|nr:cation transporter [Sunxiuqinia sp.]